MGAESICVGVYCGQHQLEAAKGWRGNTLKYEVSNLPDCPTDPSLPKPLWTPGVPVTTQTRPCFNWNTIGYEFQTASVLQTHSPHGILLTARCGLSECLPLCIAIAFAFSLYEVCLPVCGRFHDYPSVPIQTSGREENLFLFYENCYSHINAFRLQTIRDKFGIPVTYGRIQLPFFPSTLFVRVEEKEEEDKSESPSFTTIQNNRIPDAEKLVFSVRDAEKLVFSIPGAKNWFSDALVLKNLSSASLM
ncbi:hypothetical protein ANN_03048 [Periplaneta americana]|uniref:Uncharacterized protein n=1 Tax=Periplaneta americana TaxID=6978 RepID=A0ABQ8U1R1_PERAM|nr:hypothetical protein ANN_03048 [Periplaneta americana]